jgi:ABC-2 type transport system permease protein
MGVKRILGLSLALAKAEFKLRNEGSYLGIFWYLLNPLLMFALLMLVFSNRLGSDIPNYPLYLLLGIIMFNLFQQATTESTKNIYQHDNIIKSIKFPYEVLLLSTILKVAFSHIFEVIVLIIFLLFFKIPLIGMVFYPAVLFFMIIFTLGVSFILSILTIHFMDMENIWAFASRLLWFATPIFYAVGGQTKLFLFNLFNPMFYFITVARDLIVYFKVPSLWMITGMVGFSLLSLFAGLFLFTSLKKKIAELV